MIDVSKSGHHVGDCRELLKQLPDGCVQCIVTSPAYWGHRDYEVRDGQIGQEETYLDYVENMVDVFTKCHRVLRADGSLFLNLGDAYAGSWGAQSRPNGNDSKSTIEGTSMISARQIAAGQKRSGSGSKKRTPGIRDKNLIGLPWMVAFALRDRVGFNLRMDNVWHKPNAFPAPVTDRPTCAHEYVFQFSKSHSYFYDKGAVAEIARSSRPSGNGYKRAERERLKNSDGSARGDVKPWRDVGGKRNARSVLSANTEADALIASHIDEAIETSDGDLALWLLKALVCRWSDDSVWPILTARHRGGHIAVMAPEVVERCILAGSRPGDMVLDPFFGSGTTGMVAEKHGRRWIGFDIGYEQLAKERTAQRSLPIATEAAE